MPRTGWLHDQVIAVTGGGAGLGRALVDAFLEEGARVVVLERSARRCTELREQLPSDTVTVVEGDATSYDDNARTVAEAVNAFGGLDTFVANAGLWDFMRRLEDMEPAELEAAFDEVYALNVKAPLLAAKAATAELRRTGGTFLVSLSNAALFPGGGGALYVSSKHAGVGLVRQLAYELAPHVRVNGVAPGGMVTDLRGPRALGLQDTALSSIPIEAILKAGTPLQRAPRPEEYAGAYVLLASRRYGLTATGTVLDVCGGMSIIGAVRDRPADEPDVA